MSTPTPGLTTLGRVLRAREAIEERCAAAAAITEPSEIDQVSVLQVGFWTQDEPDPCDCDNYNVNCHNFGLRDRARYPIDRDLPLGAVEHWRVAASVDGHPFHIHINPFIVCPNANPFDPMPFAHWRDTYLVNLDRKVDIITEYRMFTGPYVFHCHKLTHEDDGMMQIIRVCDPSADPTCGDHSWQHCDADDLECFQALAATECALTTKNQIDAAACALSLGGPDGICGPNACVDASQCVDLPGPPMGATCDNNVCR